MLPTTIAEFSSIGLVGAGAVGKALARAFAGSGLCLTAIVDKHAAIARSLAGETQAAYSGNDLSLLPPDTQLLILAVPEAQLPSVDKQISKLVPNLRLQACVHTSGALAGSVLAQVAALGLPVGSMHPLQTFPSVGASLDLKGVYFCLEGSDELNAQLTKLVQRIGGIPFSIRPEEKSIYHAAAVFASNFIPVLVRSSLELLATLGISPVEGRKMIAPLMRQSLEYCLSGSEVSALTGPIARGETTIVQDHLKALEAPSPALRELYRELSLKALELALERGLPYEQAEAIHHALTA